MCCMPEKSSFATKFWLCARILLLLCAGNTKFCLLFKTFLTTKKLQFKEVNLELYHNMSIHFYDTVFQSFLIGFEISEYKN